MRAVRRDASVATDQIITIAISLTSTKFSKVDEDEGPTKTLNRCLRSASARSQPAVCKATHVSSKPIHPYTQSC